MIPEKLNKGDTIGVIAPSNYIKEDDLEYINASIALMEASGFKVKFGNYVFENTLNYGTDPRRRAKDINMMFADKEVKAILCVKGGEDSNSCLDYIDYEIIKNNPKIICGFSDNTSILDVINEKTGLVTYHGPTFKSFTSWDTGYAYEQFIKKLTENNKENVSMGEAENFSASENTGNNNKNISIDESEQESSKDGLEEYTEEFLSRVIGEPEDAYTTLKAGKAKGQLVGGNLSLFTKLVCGKYAVNIENKILFLEELGFETGPEATNSNIYYLKQNGVFDKIAGLWIGNYEHQSKITLEEIVMNAIGDEYSFPIIKSNNFGHIDRKTIIPIGQMAEIDTEKNEKILLEN